MQQKVDALGFHFEVVNAGVSGDTSAGGLRRLDWALQHDVRVLIVALGANDGLRGLSVGDMKQNLGHDHRARSREGAVVILAGMEAPPNYGQEYATAFRQAYRDLARQYKVQFIPFLLDKVAGQPALNQADGIHPNVQGAAIVADTVWAVLEPILEPDREFMIELRGVSKTVPSGAGTLTILHPLDLSIPDGKVTAITGASGSGKSTLLGLVAGLDAPSTGRS